MKSKSRWLVLLCLGLFLCGVASIGVGAVRLSPDKVVHALFADSTQGVAATIVWELRLPRILLAALIGAGLAASGAAFQGLFRNPLAEPFVIGAASGAALGAMLVIVNRWEGPLGMSPVPLGAFAGALIAAGVTFALSSVVRAESETGLLLIGVAVGTLLNAAVWVLMARNDQNLGRIIAWLMGSLAGRTWSDLERIWPWLTVGIGGMWLLARPLDALAEGEETARGLGLRVRWATGLVVALASLATAATVAAGGVIGFVGLIAPHIARRFVGETHGWLIPVSGLVGGMLLVVADAIARSVTAPTELPVGIITAAMGGPFFLYVLARRRM